MAVNPNFDHDAYAKKYLIKAHFTDMARAFLGYIWGDRTLKRKK